MWTVVFLIGLPSAMRNVTALALVASWALAQGYWLVTDDNFPLSVYFMADIAVLTIVYAKAISRCAGKVYKSAWDQAKCLITDLTALDRWIVASFVFIQWPLYVLQFDPWVKWHLLWLTTIVQFLLAGAESFNTWRKAKRPTTEPSSGSGSLRFAGGWSSGI